MEGRRALSYQVRHIFANIHHPFPLTASPPKGLKGFIPVGPRPTECVLPAQGNANNELLANFAEKTLEGGTKAKLEIWVVNLGEAFKDAT